ncbi:hypothetical protein ACWGJ6_08300 [Streptomyces canus]
MGAPKYVLVSYDREAEFEGEEGYEETWALCDDAEDLFADPPSPLRGVYELLGCAPEGRLSEALTRARRGIGASRASHPGDPRQDRRGGR